MQNRRGRVYAVYQGCGERSGYSFCAEKINRILVKTYEKDGKEVTVSASIGIALVEEGITFESLYERADRALYEVKNKHRNQYWIA